MLKFTARNYVMGAVTSRHLLFVSQTDPGVASAQQIFVTSFSQNMHECKIIFSMESLSRNPNYNLL